jgi:hypothetical protein
MVKVEAAKARIIVPLLHQSFFIKASNPHLKSKKGLLVLMKKLWCSSGTVMRALVASALTMEAWLEHPHLTFLLSTPLLRQNPWLTQFLGFLQPRKQWGN